MLKGIRILDFTRLLPGPFATQILADLGAEVIKIEEPIKGDYIRKNYASTIDSNSIGFHAINRGKKSVSLNLKKQNDKIKLDKLISTSDVIIESFRPGVMTKLGLNPKELLIKYPKLIICSISGYGQTGSYRLRAGHDINYLANSGILSLSKKPSLPAVQIADLCGGAMPAALQIIAALYHREKTNKGNIIDVSMTDVSYSLSVIPQSIIKNTNYQISNGKYILNGAYPCYNVYRCKDGYISVGSLEPKFWKMLCLDILNAPNLVNKGMFMGKSGENIKKEVENIFMNKTCKEWKPIIAKSDCCVEIIPNNIKQVSNSKLIKERDLDIDIPIKHPNNSKVQTITVPKSPLNMLYGVEFQNKSGPSKIGQHNQDILSKL